MVSGREAPESGRPRYAFPPSARIRRRAEFDLVFKQGERISGQGFTCYLLPRAQDTESRLGLAVSRKVGGAVSRNRVKRYIREFFRLHRSGFTRPVDLVVVAYKGAADMTGREMWREISRMLNRKGILRDREDT